MSARPDIPLGLFHDMPIAEYHGSAGISNSGLSDFARSPYHFHALHINPQRPTEEETAAQLHGNLAHCEILEPEQFMARYAVGPVDDKRIAAWKAWEKELETDFTGRTAIKPSQREIAKAQALSVRSIPDVAKLLETGRPEVSAYWIDPATGELCRCRPDFVHPVGDDAVVLVDVKTYSTAAPDEFSRQVARMGYAKQAAFYSDGYAIASGKKVLGFVFIAVESNWPYAAGAYMLPDEWLELARIEIRDLLARYAECRAADNWPGYCDTVRLLDMPGWVAREAA